MDNDRVLRLTKFIIPKEKVKKLSRLKKNRYLIFTNVLRDLNLTQKLLLYIKANPNNKEVLLASDTTLILFFLKVLISKCCNLWEFIRKSGIHREKHTFPAKLLNLYVQIEKFFTDRNKLDLFKFVRDKFVAHYEFQKDSLSSLEQAMDNIGDIEMWLSEDDSGNNIFSSSNKMMLEVIMEKIKRNNLMDENLLTKPVGEQFKGKRREEMVAMGILFALTLKIALLLQEFSIHYLTNIVLKDIGLVEKGRSSIEVPLLSETKLSLIIKNDLYKNKRR